MMRVIDFQMVHEVASAEELEVVLRQRGERGENEFWLSHRDAQYPAISVTVMDDAAVVHYFPTENEAGFQSLRRGTPQAAGTMCRFYISQSGNTIEVPNSAVVPFHLAMAAAIQFFHRNKLPACIDWIKL